MCNALFQIRHKPSESDICEYAYIYRREDGNPEQCGMELAKILAKYGDNWNKSKVICFIVQNSTNRLYGNAVMSFLDIR